MVNEIMQQLQAGVQAYLGKDLDNAEQLPQIRCQPKRAECTASSDAFIRIVVTFSKLLS